MNSCTKTLILIALLSLLYYPINSQSNSIVDSLHNEYLKTDSLINKLLILNQLCRYTQRSQPTLGRHYASLYDSIAQIGGTIVAKGKGKVLVGSSDFLEGNLVGATSNFLAGLKYFEEAQDTGFIGSAYNNLALVYINKKDTSTCLEYLKKAYNLYLKDGSLRRLAISTNNIGSLSYAIGQYKEAEEYAQKSIEYYKEQKAYDELGKPMEILADIHQIKGNHQGAIDIAKEAIKKLDEAKSTPTLIRLRTKIAKAYLSLQNTSEAKTNLDSAQKLSRGKSFGKEKRSLLNTYTRYYEMMGQWQRAHNSYQQYITVRDSLNNIEQKKELEEILQKYENEKKTQEIENLNTKNELAQNKLISARNRTYALGIGLTLITGLLLALVSLFRKTKTQNTLISKALSEKEILLKEIHHRVKNNLQFISSLLGLQTEHVSDKIALGALQEGQDRVQSMALIHQNLYQEENLTGVNMKDYFIKLINGLFDSYNIRNEEIKLDLNIENINLDVDTVIPIGLIVNELISNSLKYAFTENREGIISVQLYLSQDVLNLIVKDNGIGFSKSIEENLGQSFGYRLVHAFKEQLHATIEIDGSNGTKTHLKITHYEIAKY